MCFSVWLTKLSHFGPCCLSLTPFIVLSYVLPLLQSSICAHFVSSIPCLAQLSFTVCWYVSILSVSLFQ